VSVMGAAFLVLAGCGGGVASSGSGVQDPSPIGIDVYRRTCTRS
jgi:hypothetical protein